MPIFRSDIVEVDRDVDGSLHLTLDVVDRPMNVFNRKVLTDLDQALDAIADAARTSVLVVRSGKKSGFVAGADLKEFQTVKTSVDAEAVSAAGQRVFGKLAALPMPTVAAVSGVCLGGGLELALACDYRLVFDRRDTQMGLPETQLGLLPGWGGTQRLPRVVGLERALLIILQGKRLDAREAKAWGLADALASSDAELREQFSHLAGRAIREGKRNWNRFARRTWRQRLLEGNAVGRRLLFRAVERLLKRRVPDDMPAPFEALEAVKVGARQGIEAGFAYERAAAGRLAMTPACRNLVGVWLEQENARKLPELLESRGGTAREVRRVGVVGAGVMGAGIAQLAAVKDCEVVVREINNTALDAGIGRIRGLFDKAVERRVMAPEAARLGLAAVHGTVNWDEFDDVEVVIEAAVEDLQAKREIFRDLSARARPDTVLATNTSSLTVGSLKDSVTNPQRLAGMHFFNPVHRMPLVEVVRTPDTDLSTLATLARLAVRLGKVPVLVGDGPGFVVNRILMPYLNEAVILVGEGMTIEQIDRIMKRFGMVLGQMGPLALLDEIGLDVAAHVARAMAPAIAERFPPNPAFERMRAAGWLGNKSDKGFYIHKGKKAVVNAEAQALLQGEAKLAGSVLPPAARLAEARERMVLLMVNEAAMALGEGLADSATTIDLAMVLGTGWAPQRGGPLHYADTRGPGDVVQALRSLASRYGRRFEPCTELVRRAEQKEPFVQPMTPAD
jgi:3-hydroxyacyl-CoA dehydrogenase/enoyl-CoA hydratase/3-hydroxybutyryl-CoA epimerase